MKITSNVSFSILSMVSENNNFFQSSLKTSTFYSIIYEDKNFKFSMNFSMDFLL